MVKLRTFSFIFIGPLVLLFLVANIPYMDIGGHKQDISNIQYTMDDYEFQSIQQANWNNVSDINKINHSGGKTIWVRFTLPPSLVCESDCYLYVNNIYEIYEVYFQGSKVYGYGDFLHPEPFYGRNLNLIPLGSTALANETVYFKIHSELKWTGIKGVVLVGNKADLIDALYKKNFVLYFIVILLMLLFSLFAAILGLRKGLNCSYLLLSLYLLTHAIHTFTSTDIKILFYNSPSLWEYIRQYCNDAIPITFILFIRSYFREYSRNMLFKWWSNFIFITHAVFMGILIVAHVMDLGFKYMSGTLSDIGTINFLITVIAIIVIAIKQANLETKVLAFGMVTFLMFNLYENLNNIFNPPHRDSIVTYGLFITMLCIVFIHIRRINEVYRNQEIYLTQLEHSNKQLEHLSKVKDEFLANTSHELRTPLNGIIGITESVIDQLDGPKDHIRRNLNIVISSGKRLSNLVNDLLDFSKLKHREIKLLCKSVDISQIISIVAAVNKTLLKGKDVEIINLTSSPLFVYGDENRIQQILFNLIGNAIKFTERGSITITGSRLEDQVEIRITDTGIGIPEDQLETIFQSFVQADSSLSRRYGGTGLGLSITKQLVEMHGGYITVESTVGQGSTFIFTLPIGEEQSATSLIPIPEMYGGYNEAAPSTDIQAEQQSGSKQHTIQVLVVEDDPINVQVILNHLSMHNWGTIVASNGMKALEIVESQEVDLILLDVMMPNMSGYEVCEKIREVYTPDELPVIMLTARDTADDIARGFEAGANDYITKPFSKKELLARIEARLKLQETKKSKPLLTKTEIEILSYYYQYQGETRKQILDRINQDRGDNAISEKTLMTHITNTLKKISAANMMEAAKLAKKKRLI
ncbi:ATP-binding response regulator [Paenibacillus xylaniclasticus]|uniref:ATP-binding response regulator n=1 Tax=Paenibacillus xylaniclasticus TaxID=588083 RepID=UPI000FD9BA25|nr:MULTISPECIES: ATP-binding protein [Paenibacillus]GFN33029.1 hypothetical protein PCURB6_32890 [Paenibacillus curdlanolyticus]